jgi:hypothetical protein
MRTPLVLDDFHTMPQEAPNAGYARSQGLGLAVQDRPRMLEVLESLSKGSGPLAGIRKKLQAFRVQDASPLLFKAMAKAMKRP